MQSGEVRNQSVNFHYYNTVIVGSGAAGMNCAVHLYEFMSQRGTADAAERIAVVTGGLRLGASRMSGSDKQTYYKLGTSLDAADSAENFARSLTAGGCCHHDLALVEATGSIREFYHLVQAGVPFPHDGLGGYFGYKTDNDPYERATSAGPKTSKFMSECLEKQVRAYGIAIDDEREVAALLTAGGGDARRIAGVVTLDKSRVGQSDYGINVYYCRSLVLAAGGPGELYEMSVYPRGQVGIHGIALKAGLAAENLTESQFGVASVKFRWNVSGSYFQAIPRIFSAEADGGDERDFLAVFWPSVSELATNIFLKGYQWPFDPERVPNRGSSLIDILIFNETQKGRRVFMDFLHNPAGGDGADGFRLESLGPEAYEYLDKAGALQAIPIERLTAMNPPAVEIFKEHGIDLYREPLEVAVCAQHNNGGFAVDKWWQSNLGGTFVIGEMAGTHGVKRPGGSALNAGQVGGLRAAEYIANVCGLDAPDYSAVGRRIEKELNEFVGKLDKWSQSGKLNAKEVIGRIQGRMTACAAHIREAHAVRAALAEAVKDYKRIQEAGFKPGNRQDFVVAVRAEHMALGSIAYLKAISALLEAGGGSRGSYLVVDEGGIEIHRDITDRATGEPLRFKPENESLRGFVLRIKYDAAAEELFSCESIAVRPAVVEKKAFEPAWRDYREGKIFGD